MSETINQENIKNLLNDFEEAEVMGAFGLDAFSNLLELDNENFKIIAPGILVEFQKEMNNSNSRLALVQSLRAMNIEYNDLFEDFSKLDETLQNTDLSVEKQDFIRQIISITLNTLSEVNGLNKRYVRIPYEFCHENAKEPQYAHDTDSSMDVFALDDYTIMPGETKLIPTGIKMAIPFGYEIQVRPKSGRALKTKLRIANTPGTIKVA